MVETLGYAAQSAKTLLKPFFFERHNPKSYEIQLEILYCGVCHSDLHKLEEKFDFLISTMPDAHDVNEYVKLLKTDGAISVLGCLVPFTKPLDPDEIARKRRSVTGSLMGGIKETQEMLDFCSKHNITADIEIIGIEKINEAFKKIKNKNVKFRFVIDMKSLQENVAKKIKINVKKTK